MKMPLFRVKFSDPDGLWWTGPLANWVDVCTLVHQQRQRGVIAEGFFNDATLDEEVKQIWAAAHAEQLSSDKPAVGMVQWGCSCGQCNLRATSPIVRVPLTSPIYELADGTPVVVGGFPLLDAEPAESIEQDQPESGEDLEPATIPFTPAPAAPTRPPAAASRLVSILDWLNGLVLKALGISPGMEI